MADLPDRPAEDTTGEQAGREEALVKRAFAVAERFYPNRESEHCKALARAIYCALVDTDTEPKAEPSIRPSDDELRHKIQDLVWDKIMWPWNEAYKSDRHVPLLYMRSDPVLHRLADLIAEQLCAAREMAVAEHVLTPDQQRKLLAWQQEQNAKVLAEQQKEHPTWTRPHFGAIGGSLTFCTTATSLGMMTKVIFCKGHPYEAELDLTDYSDW